MVKNAITKELKQIIVVNESILNSLMAQKARNDKLLNKYQKGMEDELGRPANMFMDWTKTIVPYNDSVLSGKVIDYDIIKRLQIYVKEVVKYNSEFLVSQDEIDRMQFVINFIINVVFKLEQKLTDYESFSERVAIEHAINAIYNYSLIPEESKETEGVCVYCGLRLNDNNSKDGICCKICAKVPEKFKPKISEDPAEETEEQTEEEALTESEEKTEEIEEIPYEDEDEEKSMKEYENEVKKESGKSAPDVTKPVKKTKAPKTEE